jgi:mycoredoxin
VEESVILFGHAGCPSVPLVRAVLESSAVPFHYVDIRRDPAGRGRVINLNGGNESVPTLVFPDGSVLTEPSAKHLCEKLVSLGYSAVTPAWIPVFERILVKIASQKPDAAL